MSRDLIVNITSRDRPEQLLRTIELLLKSCCDPSSFRLHLIIDSDQIDLYSPVTSRYPGIVLGIAEHEQGSLRNCFLQQLKLFRESDARLLIGLCDDCYGAPHHWDRFILRHQAPFPDGLYSLYTKSFISGRYPDIMHQCYCLDSYSSFMNRPLAAAKQFTGIDLSEPLSLDFLALYEYCELFPVHTRQFAHYVEKAYTTSHHALSIDIVTAALIQQLHRATGLRRHLPALPESFRFVNDYYVAKCVADSSKSDAPKHMQQLRDIATEMGHDIAAANGLKDFSGITATNDAKGSRFGSFWLDAFSRYSNGSNK